MTQPPRKGARRMADIPPAILKQINRGDIETITLVEALAVDFNQLLKSTFGIREKIDPALGFIDRIRESAKILHDDIGLEKTIAHKSDMIRGCAAHIIALTPSLSLKERLRLVKPLADDPNQGVREYAWIFLRPHIMEDIQKSITLLTPWATHKSAYIRRYASEITRPRGVWCAHIPELKADPKMALPILEPLKSDTSKYVRDSVGNWLNDASKTDEKFVRALTAKWMKQSPTKETTHICRRALRSINK